MRRRTLPPGEDNSNLINTEKAVPIIPANTANIKYNVPISLALVENNHLVMSAIAVNLWQQQHYSHPLIFRFNLSG